MTRLLAAVCGVVGGVSRRFLTWVICDVLGINLGAGH